MSLFLLANLLLSTTSLVLIVFLLIYGKTVIHRIWTVCNISIFAWGFGSVLIDRSESQPSLIIAWSIALVGGYFIAVLYYHTVYILTERKNNKFLVFAYLFTFLASLFTIFFRHIVIPNFRLMFNSIYYPIATFSYLVIYIGWGLIASTASFELLRFIKLAKGIEIVKAKYILIAFSIGFIGGGSVILPSFGIYLYPIGNIGVALYCLIVTYAIVRYRLMNINVAIARGAIFGIVYALVLGVPFGLLILGKDKLISILGQESWIWVPMLTLLFFATSGPFIYMFLQRKALNRILAEEKHAHNLLLKASQGMTQVRNLKKLLGLIVHFVSKILKTTNAQIFLFDENLKSYSLRASRFLKSADILNLDSKVALIGYLESNKEPLVEGEIKALISTNEKFKKIENQMSGLKASVIIPCLIEEKLLGFLALGDKKSTRMYTQDDLDVLTTLANQAALAIQNAQFFEEVKETQEQLYQAEKMATIGTMADGLSHQINNRFNALSLIAGDTLDTIKLVDKNNVSPETKDTFDQIQKALKKIEDNVKTGGEIVRGLLKYSRPGEEGLEPTSLDDVVNASLDMAQYKVKLSEIDIIKNYDLDLPKIKMNSTQIQEVFFNLIDNAFFAIKLRKEELKEEGFKGEINISADQLNGKLKIEVSDNGMGVKKEDFEKLFTPFFTTKASSKKGTGLGLFVIQKIITDTHKGKIAVASNYKEGTTFTIELPIS